MVHIRIKEIEEYAKENNVPIMQQDGIEFLINFIKENNIKNILEIGSAIGYSAIRMALTSNDIKVVTIERDLDRYELACKNIYDFKLNDRINIILGDALETEIYGTYDLIFIDAAKSQSIKFFEKYSKNLNKNGAIITDNLAFHGLVKNEDKIINRNTRQLVRKIKKYIEYLKENPHFITRFYEIGDGISVSIRKDDEN